MGYKSCIMAKIFTIALVVDDLGNYLQAPQLAQVANNVINVVTGSPVPNPDYAAFQQPHVVTPVKIPNSSAGDVIFLEWLGGDQYQVITRLSYPGFAKIKEVWEVILSGPLDGDGAKIVTYGSNLPMGLGLIRLNIPDFLPNLPPLVWLLIALLAGAGAYTNKKIFPRVALGAVTWIAAAKFVQTTQKNIKL